MNKRQAKFIMQLPDGYEWEFLNNGKYLAGYCGTNILLYEIIGDELVQQEIGFPAEPLTVPYQDLRIIHFPMTK